MKYINRIVFFLICVLICFSCKKNDEYDFEGDSQNRVFFRTGDNTVNGTDRLSMKMIQNQNNVFMDPIRLFVHSTKPANGDINVSLRIASELIDEYNLENNTEYPLFPIEALATINYNLDILSGTMTSENAFEIKVNSEVLKTIEQGIYLLPIALCDISGNATMSLNKNVVYFLIDLSSDNDNIWNTIPNNMGVIYSGSRKEWKAEAFSANFPVSYNFMFDGDEITSTSCVFDESGEEPSIIIDMQEINDIAGLYELFLWDSFAILKSDIYTSIDNKIWDYQGEYVDSDLMSNIFFYDIIEARYIKIVIKESKKNMIEINEFNVYVKNN